MDQDKRDYQEVLEDVIAGRIKLPKEIATLTPAGKSRLNRLFLLTGMMYVYWDTEDSQLQLAKDFEPLLLADCR